MPGPSDEVKYSSEDFEQLKRRLREVGFAEIRIVSGSMSPLLPIGALARVEPCTYEDLARYDMLVFWLHGRLTCHCVWDHGAFPAANGERTLVTKGLANWSSDDPVHESWILGRVVSHRATALSFYWNHFRARWRLSSGGSRDRT